MTFFNVLPGESSFRSLMPGSWHVAERSMLSWGSCLPICMSNCPWLFSMRTAATATKRSSSPALFMMTMDLPAVTSDSRASKSRVPPPNAWAAQLLRPLICVLCCCSAFSPMATCASRLMHVTICSKLARGTSKSLGQPTCMSVQPVSPSGSGLALMIRLWKHSPYALNMLATTWCDLTAWMKARASMTTSLQDFFATAEPTWIHSDHNAASQIHCPSETHLCASSLTAEESGCCVY
mmetsp:Transcript_6438/g.15261  ORF Transcript_6438/g.15261 Transcript_6438/m.15261 type:complete len:237 (+) Transcript_6438:816-1526(+)